MVRTQIYLPEATHQALKYLAKSQKKSMAQVIRELVEASLKKGRRKSSLLTRLSRLKFEGPEDLSKAHDKYLYGKDE